MHMFPLFLPRQGKPATTIHMAGSKTLGPADLSGNETRAGGFTWDLTLS